MDLETIFSIVLQNAITAQNTANQYSADLARKIQVSQVPGDNNLVKDISYFPVPNSTFDNINLNLKVKLEDIKVGVEKTYVKVFNRAASRLQVQTTDIGDLLTDIDADLLASALFQINPMPEESIISKAATFLGLYLYHKEKLSDQSQELSKSERHSAVLGEVKKSQQLTTNSGDARLQQLVDAVNNSVAGMVPYQSMVFNADSNVTDPAQLCDIGIKLKMRTFSWGNYDAAP